MVGFIYSIAAFRKTSVSELLQELTQKNQGVDSSQVVAWRTLIDDVKSSLGKISLPDDVCIGIEYELPTDGMGIDLMLAGRDICDCKFAFIIEAKQWNSPYIQKTTFSCHRAPGVELHPQLQISRHKLSFKEYLDIGKNYNVFPYVFVRNCSAEALGILQEKNLDVSGSKNIPMYSSLDTIFYDFKSCLRSGDLSIIDDLKNAEYVPSRGIIDAMQSIITREPPFILTSEQEKIINKIYENMEAGKKIIRITGAAGAGKTAILLNLYVEFLNNKIKGGLTPIFVSGAQNTAYYQSKYANVRNSFTYSFSLDKMLGQRVASRKIVLMDEAQHNQEGIITNVVNSGASLILCYDPGQIINANNALEELETLEKRDDFVSLNLKESVRFNGSKIAENNIKSLLNGNVCFSRDDKFDFQVFPSFSDFQNKIITLMKKEVDRTIAVVGLLSSDSDDYTYRNNPDSIFFTDWSTQNSWEKAECRWMPYVTNKNYLNQNNGKIWVGTWWMPGLDADYICVIIGGDAKLTSNGLIAVPEKAKHYRMLTSVATEIGLPENLIAKQIRRGEASIRYAQTGRNILAYLNDPNHSHEKALFIERFSQLLRNNYYIMMSRGCKGCYVYFADNEISDSPTYN